LSLLLVLGNRHVWPETAAPAPATAAGSRPAAPAVVARRLLPTVIWSTALYGMYTYLGAWLTQIGFSTEEIAQVIGCYGIGAIVGTLGGGRIADRIGAKAATGASLAGLFAAFLLLPLTLHPGLLIALAFSAASAVAQVFFPAQQLGLISDFPARRATVLALNNSSLFLGIALGSLIGGQVAAHGTFEASLRIWAAFALAGWLINRVVVTGRAAG
jgi:predicted MFS family arabinose efflux permease